MKYFCNVNGNEHEVEVVERLGELHIQVNGEDVDFRFEETDRLGQVVLIFGGRSYAVSIEGDMSIVDITLAGHGYHVELENERERAARAAERSGSKGGGEVKAVMPGMVVRVLVSPGESVTKGSSLVVLEAMKMQNEITASADGVVDRVHVKEGEAVGAGTKLVTLRAPESA